MMRFSFLQLSVKPTSFEVCTRIPRNELYSFHKKIFNSSQQLKTRKSRGYHSVEPEWLRRLRRTLCQTLIQSLGPSPPPARPAHVQVCDQKGIHYVQVMKHASKEYTLALKPRADITISPTGAPRGPRRCYPIVPQKGCDDVHQEFILKKDCEMNFISPPTSFYHI